MKRLVLSLLFSMLGAFLFLGFHNDNLRARAYGSQPNIFYIETEELTESMIVANGYQNVAGLADLQAGDYRATLMVQNNTGFSTFGSYYDMSNLYFDVYRDGYDVYFIPGEAAGGLSMILSFNVNNGRIVISGVSLTNNTANGEIVSFFLKRKPSSPSNAEVPSFSSTFYQIIDSNLEEVEYTEVLPSGQPSHTLIAYTIGDIDGDGEVTAYDSSVLMTVINSTNATLTAANAQTYFDYCVQTYGTDLDGMYPQNVFVFDVADLNQDGVIDSNDSGLILSYFSFITAGLDPELNPAIAHLGTTGYYVA